MDFICRILLLVGFVCLLPLNIPGAVIANVGEKESEAHGARSPHEKFEDEHYKDGGHNVEKDHEAVLGSKKMAEEFDHMSPDESKKRLRLLAKKMDTDGDGFVSKPELIEWITKSMADLDAEEAQERFEEMDDDKDGTVTWKEYVSDAFGDEIEIADMDESDKRLMREDEYYFKAADGNGDGKLDNAEFAAFQVPENHPHMHDALVHQALADKDSNKDGVIDFKEFINDQGESFKQPDAEWYQVEKTRFEDDYDVDKDGTLDRKEMLRWLVPDLAETATEEANHLFGETDSDKDERLSLDEIVSQHQLWVGSEATNYGDHLESIKDEL